MSAHHLRPSTALARRAACAGLLALAFTLLAPPAHAQEQLPPVWQCLPEETVFLIRFPDPMQSVEVLRERTQFGGLVFDEDRWVQVGELIRENDPDMWQEMTDDLGRVGLTPEDLPRFLTGSFGYAMVMEPRHDRHEPLLLGLGWLEPGEEMADKGLDAVARMIEHQDDDAEHPTRRVDLDIAGHRVMHLSTPHVTMHFDRSGIEFDQDPDVFRTPHQEGAPPPDDIDAAMRQLAQRMQRRQVDQINFFLTRLGGRILVAQTFPNNTARFSDLAAGQDEPDIDYDVLSGVDDAIAVFGRFLRAHDARGEDYGARILATPGLDAALPAGHPLVEVFGDFRPAWNLLQDADDPTGWDWVRRLGLDDLTAGGMRFALDGQVLRNGLFLAAPEPRRGAVQLLDQPPLDPAPPAWVSDEVIDYTHISFDLARAYAFVRDIVEDEVGQEAVEVFDQIDMQAQQLVRADMEGILSAFGHRHMFVSYPPRLEGDDAEMVTPMAFVWRLADEPVVERLIQAAGIGQMMFGPMLAPAEEQGFTGWRLDTPELPMALMVGRGFLTLAMGQGVTEQVLSVLRNPPEPEAALASSDRLRRLAEVFEPRPGIAFNVSDMGRYVDSLVAIFLRAMEEEMQFHADDAAVAAQIEQFRQVLPDEDELRGMFDVSGSHVYLSDEGLVSEGALILPPPDQ